MRAPQHATCFEVPDAVWSDIGHGAEAKIVKGHGFVAWSRVRLFTRSRS
jgi:hypothetical protein